MINTLAKICAEKREHILACKSAVPEAQLHAKIQGLPPTKGFHRALKYSVAQSGYGLIAEIKKASPSKGLIRADFDPATIARSYVKGGASCISVLTDTPYFQGRDEYLKQVRACVDVPLLRKDFMLDSYQVYEARVLGADCILLIMAALTDLQAKELEVLAHELGMDVLVEVHDEDELHRALTHLTSTLIGINNRNLKTLAVDLATSERLAKFLPKDATGVCESGINTNNDLINIKEIGISCFLVGESLMRQSNIELATKQLLGRAGC